MQFKFFIVPSMYSLTHLQIVPALLIVSIQQWLLLLKVFVRTIVLL